MADMLPEPSPLGEAAEGFVNLAGWFTTLVGDQVVSVARALDSRSFDANAAAASLARSAALPLLGWAALANEMLEAASILTEPLQGERTLLSDVFQAPRRGHARDVSPVEPSILVNGFDKPLQASSVVPIRSLGPGGKPKEGDEPPPEESLSLGSAESEFVLVAVDVPPKCVGVYKGQATVTVTEPGPQAGSTELVDVWLVVP